MFKGTPNHKYFAKGKHCSNFAEEPHEMTKPQNCGLLLSQALFYVIFITSHPLILPKSFITYSKLGKASYNSFLVSFDKPGTLVKFPLQINHRKQISLQTSTSNGQSIFRALETA